MSGLSGQSQDAWDTGAPTAPAGGGSALDAAALAQLTEAVSRQTLRYADVEGETIGQRQHIARLEEMLHQQDRCLRDLSDCIGGMERKIEERMDAYERSASSLIEKAFRELHERIDASENRVTASLEKSFREIQLHPAMDGGSSRASNGRRSVEDRGGGAVDVVGSEERERDDLNLNMPDSSATAFSIRHDSGVCSSSDSGASGSVAGAFTSLGSIQASRPASTAAPDHARGGKFDFFSSPHATRRTAFSSGFAATAEKGGMDSTTSVDFDFFESPPSPTLSRAAPPPVAPVPVRQNPPMTRRRTRRPLMRKPVSPKPRPSTRGLDSENPIAAMMKFCDAGAHDSDSD